MTDIMMMLGDFMFSVDTAAYDQFKHRTAWHWKEQGRLNRTPALQYTGAAPEQIDLSGTILPHYSGGLNQLNEMRAHANKAQPLLLVDGLGHVRGDWVILSIEESQSRFIEQGLPLKVDFTLKLQAYGADQ